MNTQLFDPSVCHNFVCVSLFFQGDAASLIKNGSLLPNAGWHL